MADNLMMPNEAPEAKIQGALQCAAPGQRRSWSPAVVLAHTVESLVGFAHMNSLSLTVRVATFVFSTWSRGSLIPCPFRVTCQ